MVPEESLADVLRVWILAFIGFFQVLQLCANESLLSAGVVDILN